MAVNGSITTTTGYSTLLNLKCVARQITLKLNLDYCNTYTFFGEMAASETRMTSHYHKGPTNYSINHAFISLTMLTNKKPLTSRIAFNKNFN